MINRQLAFRRIFEDLDKFYDSSKNSDFVRYKEFVNPIIFSPSLVGKILTRVSNKFLMFFHILFDGFLDLKSERDAQEVKIIGEIIDGVDEIREILKKESFASRSILLEDKYHKLNSNIPYSPSIELEQRISHLQRHVKESVNEILAEVGSFREEFPNLSIEPVIINNDRVKTLKRFNLGCGKDIRKGYINVDSQRIEGVDIIADIRKLPTEIKKVEEIFVSRIVESLTEKELKEALVYWYSLLGSKGIIRIIALNAPAVIADYYSKAESWRVLRDVIFGESERNGNRCGNIFSVDYLTDLISEVLPSAIVKIIALDKPNGKRKELEIKITKP